MSDNQRLCLIHTINYFLLVYYIFFGLFSIYHLPVILVFLFIYLLIGIVAGYHRYFTHQSFKASRFSKILMLMAGTLSTVGAVIGWVSVHRKHHRYSDTERDPHSPFYKGALKVWFGYYYNIYEVEGKYGAKLARDKDIMFFQQNYYKIILSYVAILALIDPVLVIVAYSIPQLLALNATSAINVLTHTGGSVKDSKLLGYLIVGEGWHKTHHDRPLEYRLHKHDITGFVIKHFLSRI